MCPSGPSDGFLIHTDRVTIIKNQIKYQTNNVAINHNVLVIVAMVILIIGLTSVEYFISLGMLP